MQFYFTDAAKKKEKKLPPAATETDILLCSAWLSYRSDSDSDEHLSKPRSFQ